MSSNNISWEIIQMSNRRLQAQQRRFLRRRTTTIPQQVSNLQQYYQLLITGAHRPSRGTSSHRLNNNRTFAVTPQGGLFSCHGGSQQASRRLPHQFVTTLAIRSLKRISHNNPAIMSAYGRLRAACLSPPPAQNRPTPPPLLPPLNDTMVVNERVRSQEPIPSEEPATTESGGNSALCCQPAGQTH